MAWWCHEHEISNISVISIIILWHNNIMSLSLCSPMQKIMTRTVQIFQMIFLFGKSEWGTPSELFWEATCPYLLRVQKSTPPLDFALLHRFRNCCRGAISLTSSWPSAKVSIMKKALSFSSSQACNFGNTEDNLPSLAYPLHEVFPMNEVYWRNFFCLWQVGGRRQVTGQVLMQLQILCEINCVAILFYA